MKRFPVLCPGCQCPSAPARWLATETYRGALLKGPVWDYHLIDYMAFPSARSRSILRALCWLVLGVPGSSLPAQTAPFAEPRKVELNDELGRGVQRFMKRLEESTPDHQNTVHVLFYGQSITEQKWAGIVADDLRRRYPNVHFLIENRAIGGFASSLLIHTAEADLYPFYPDLLIFYDFGRHDCYEDIIRRVRERTTSEIVLQTDHPTSAANLSEETDPAKLTMKDWSSWFPNVWIPTVAAKYRTGMVQQRTLWKAYCQQNALDPRSLTVDGAHLNDQGNFLMARLVGAYLERRSQYDDPATDREVRDLTLDRDVRWEGNRLTLAFTGNRIDVIAAPGATGGADVLIDGRKPSEFPELYQPTRVSGYPGIGWPIIGQVDHPAPLALEEWTATATDFSPDGKHFKFQVRGSVTGPDGEGTSDAPFVSRSGRVVIQPDYWNIGYSFGLLQGPWAKDQTKGAFVPPGQVEATWRIVPEFTDVYLPPILTDPAVETPVVLAQGLSNGPHELQLIGHDGPVHFQALRVYQPPLGVVGPTKAADARDPLPVPTFAPPMEKKN